jgi:hypothetical protein
MDLPEQFPIDITHPAWVTSIGTLISYGLILFALFVGIFIVPYLVFTLLL